MKENIHPPYHDTVIVRCSCGNTWETGSTQKELTVEVCSACHPFYTGKRKLVDVAGRVDKFKKRLEAAGNKQTLILTAGAQKQRRTVTQKRKRKVQPIK